MLSVLIPSYNYNIFPLVKGVYKSAIKAHIEFEIIALDDGSNSKLNKINEKINALECSKFIALKDNIGLSNGRNMLADLSKYEYVLFIDGDSIIIADDYISNYIKTLSATKGIDIVFGGRLHPKSINSNNKTLRWNYGKKVEDKAAKVRIKHPYKTLMFNNTLIKKSCFKKIKFEETLKQYGHEDTLFAYQASLQKLCVKHIDNAIEHGDIDTNDVFLKKTTAGLENLKLLLNNKLVDPNFVKLLKWYNRLRILKIDYLVSIFYRLFKSSMLKNLKSKKPSLTIFKLFKLGYLSNITN